MSNYSRESVMSATPEVFTSMRLVALLLLGATLCGTTRAQPPVSPIQTAGSLATYELIGRYDVARLNRILTEEIPRATGATVAYTPAKCAVNLYRVTYSSRIPEQENRPTRASGLIAIPEHAAGNMPLVSYQHGTVLGRADVPSFPEESFETRLMIAQFASQGYVLIGADYFGLGTSTEKDGYMVMRSQQQACLDMHVAALAVLKQEQIVPTSLFLTGWSQGGVVTMAFLESLGSLQIPVTAAGTACAQCDGFVMLNGFLNFPRPIDAPWLSAVFILTAFSFEEYHNIPGLAESLFTPEAYQIAKGIYLKDGSVDPAQLPTDLRTLIRSEYFDPAYFKASTYGRLISTMHTYRWVIRTPVRMYYGEVDECLTVGLAKLPMEYQRALGNTTVEAISTGPDANHRMAFARAVPEWKKWFDSLIAK